MNATPPPPRLPDERKLPDSQAQPPQRITMPSLAPRKSVPTFSLALLAALLELAAPAEAAKSIRFSSQYGDATVFRDKVRNGVPNVPPELSCTTDSVTGSCDLPRGKGRVYLTGGKNLRTGADNDQLLTAPPSALAVGTLSSLWQSLLDRKQKPRKIRIFLNVPAKVTLADFTLGPLAETKNKPKTLQLQKKDGQQHVLVSFLKTLVKPRNSAGLRNYRPQAGKKNFFEDTEIGALAAALIAGKATRPVNLADLEAVRSTLEGALSRLAVVTPPTPEELDLVVIGITSLNKAIDQLTADSPPLAESAIDTRLQNEMAALVSADLNQLRDTAFPAPVIAGVDPDTGTSHSDGITNVDTPSLFGSVDPAATSVRIYRIDPATQARTKLAEVAPDSAGNWRWQSPALEDGTYQFGVTGIAASATEFESEMATIGVTVVTALPGDTPPSVDRIVTNSATPVITGSWSPAPDRHLAVTVNGTRYSGAPALDASSSNWTLTIPAANPLPDQVYNVLAEVVDDAGNVRADQTLDELTIQQIQLFSDTPLTLAAGSVPRALASSRIDGDTLTDLVVANQGGGSVSVFYADGSGGFRNAAAFAAGTTPVAVAAGDLDNDGATDLVIANLAGDSVSVLQADGDGGFLPALQYPAGSRPLALVLGQFNADGLLDAAVADSGGDRVAVLLNDGSGGFLAPVTYAVGRFPAAIRSALVDADAIPDLVVANRDSRTVSVLPGKGDGTYGSKIDTVTATNPSAVALGDLDQDGKTDLAVAGGCCRLTVALGKGDGTFQNAVDHPVGTDPSAVLIGDLDGDGHADLAAANWGSDSVSILLGNGSGQFPTSLSYAAGTTGSHPVDLVTGDFNQDGRPDLGVANYSADSVTVLRSLTGP